MKADFGSIGFFFLIKTNNAFVGDLVFTDSVHLSLSLFYFFILKMAFGVERWSIPSQLSGVPVDAGHWTHLFCIS